MSTAEAVFNEEIVSAVAATDIKKYERSNSTEFHR